MSTAKPEFIDWVHATRKCWISAENQGALVCLRPVMNIKYQYGIPYYLTIQLYSPGWALASSTSCFGM
jgi:hypothetical protein